MPLLQPFLCREYTEYFPDIVYKYFNPLVTIPMAPMTTGMTKHFIFHFRWVSTPRFLYFNFFSIFFCITFLFGVIDMSVKQMLLCLAFNYYVWSVAQNLSVFTPWSNSTVIPSCSHTALGMCVSGSFLLFRCLISCIFSDTDVCRLYLVLWGIHSLLKWDILLLGDQ